VSQQSYMYLGSLSIAYDEQARHRRRLHTTQLPLARSAPRYEPVPIPLYAVRRTDPFLGNVYAISRGSLRAWIVLSGMSHCHERFLLGTDAQVDVPQRLRLLYTS